MSDIPHRLYSPAPVLKRPSQFFRDMVTDLMAARELAYALAKRDIKSQYRQNLLGYVWAFLPILGTTFVFLFLRAGGAFNTADSHVPYLVYIFIGTILWQLFVEGINKPLQSVTAGKQMLTKINFPREALVLSGIFSILFTFLIRVMIMIPALMFFGWRGMYTFSWSSLILFPIGVIGVIVLAVSMGLILVPVGMFYRDVKRGLAMLITFWMFVSPVVLPIPESGLAATVMRWNPVTPVLDTARSWLLGVEPLFFGGYLAVMAASFVLLFIGWVMLRVAYPHIICRMGM